MSDYDVRNAAPRSKVYKIGDGGRLWLYIQPTGQKVFRLLWRTKGKQKQFTIGEYPKVTLHKARKERDRIAGLLAQGIDPTLSREKIDTEQKLKAGKLTFKTIALEWYEKRTTNLDPVYRATKLKRLERYVFPVIGETPIQNVKYRALISIVQRIEDENHPEMVRRVVQLICQVFRYAKIMEYIEVNTAQELKDAISLPTKGGHRAALVEPYQISKLLKAIDKHEGHVSMKYALKILPYVFLRSQELRRATWSEINFEEAVWIIPAEHMKKKREHVVPLARQVVQLLQELTTLVGDSELLFPSLRDPKQCISDEGLLGNLRRLGYTCEEMCIHGFRSMASTRLNEMGFRADVIEAQLAHMQENKVRAAYNRAMYFEERKEMMQKWADYLDELRASDLPEPPVVDKDKDKASKVTEENGSSAKKKASKEDQEKQKTCNAAEENGSSSKTKASKEDQEKQKACNAKEENGSSSKTKASKDDQEKQKACNAAEENGSYSKNKTLKKDQNN